MYFSLIPIDKRTHIHSIKRTDLAYILIFTSILTYKKHYTRNSHLKKFYSNISTLVILKQFTKNTALNIIIMPAVSTDFCIVSCHILPKSYKYL